jgi:hypothetical protein
LPKHGTVGFPVFQGIVACGEVRFALDSGDFVFKKRVQLHAFGEQLSLGGIWQCETKDEGSDELRDEKPGRVRHLNLREAAELAT